MTDPHSPNTLARESAYRDAYDDNRIVFVTRMSESPQAVAELVHEFEWADEIAELLHKTACFSALRGTDEQIGQAVRAIFDRMADGYAALKAEREVSL